MIVLERSNSPFSFFVLLCSFLVVVLLRSSDRDGDLSKNPVLDEAALHSGKWGVYRVIVATALSPSEVNALHSVTGAVSTG